MQGLIKNSREDLQTMTSSFSFKSTGFDTESYHSTIKNHQQIKATKATTYFGLDHSPAPRRPPSPSTISPNNNNERAKSADQSRISLNETMPTASMSSSTYTTTVNNPTITTTSRLSRATNVRSNGAVGLRSSTAHLDELRTTEQETEKRELNTLNSRFVSYLEKIKHLANVNANLRRQVDDAYRKYIGHTDEQQTVQNINTKNFIKKYQHPSEIQLNHLRKQITDEVRAQTLIHIRLQRAEYDIKFYQTNIKLLSSHDQKQSEQIRTMRQQLEVNLHELEQLKQQYGNREQDLQNYKTQYDEYMNKLIGFSNEYDNIAYQRMENENTLYTIKEQLSFEQEYYQRRQQEYEFIEKFHYDFNKEFTKTEFHNIVKQIRQDYQEFNAIRLAELEILYKSKLETVRNEITKRDEKQELTKPRDVHVEIDSSKKEHRTLIEQNQLLKDKLEQLKHDLQNIIEQNRQRYEVSDKEYKQLQMEIPELDCVIVHLRENAVNLWSEINTYRYLLLNLLTPTNEKSPQPIQKSSYSTLSTSTDDNHIQESKNLISMTKPMVNKITSTTTVGTKAKSPYPHQYRDETTGFTVHIEDGIVWVRI